MGSKYFRIAESSNDEFYVNFSKETINGFEMFFLDKSIAKELNITLSRYQKILKKYGAKPGGNRGDCYFPSMQTAKLAREELESILVLNKLLEENV